MDGFPDTGSRLLHNGLSLLQGPSNGCELRTAAQDPGGFGIKIVLAPADEVVQRCFGDAGGEQVGGQHVDGAAFEEGVVAGLAFVGVSGGCPEESLGAALGCLDRRTTANRVPTHGARPVGSAGEIEDLDS